MSLDQFVFELDTVSYHELQRQTTWKHGSTSRIGARDALQFNGPGENTITLNCVLMPELIGDIAALQELHDMGDVGESYVMVDGAGTYHGAFIISSIHSTESYFNSDGTPQKIDFSINLKRVADDLLQQDQQEEQPDQQPEQQQDQQQDQQQEEQEEQPDQQPG